jgi:hypothetical protein
LKVGFQFGGEIQKAIGETIALLRKAGNNYLLL